MFKLFKRKDKTLTVADFAHANRNYLVIVLDPKDNTMFMAYKDKQIYNRFNSVDGKNRNVVKQVLKHSVFEKEIDTFIGAMVEALKTPLDVVENALFFKWIDGALYNIGQALKLQKEEKVNKNK